MLNIVSNIIWDINPAIIQIGSFELRYYSVFFALSFIIPYVILRKIYHNENINTNEVDRLLIWTIIGGILGARIGHCVFYEWAYYKNHILEIIIPIQFTPEIKFVGYHGIASHGGAIGIIISIMIFKIYSEKRSFFWIVDRVVVPVGFAGALIRIGNFFNSEIYGLETNLPWGVVFVNNNEILPKHPTQIYEALAYIISSVVLCKAYKNKKIRNQRGQLFGLFLILIFTARFFIEFLKNNQVSFEDNLLLNMGQILSIPAIISGIIIIAMPKLKHFKS